MSHNFSATNISYSQTGYFSKIVTDYLSQNNFLKNFSRHSPDLGGIKNAISQRKIFSTDRKLLVQQLEDQYKSIETSDALKANITALISENAFTVCTAHQPNIFTGHLYFIYKIIHTIKLTDSLNKEMPQNHFVPVFYMGSEDADLEELGHIFINGEKHDWNTKQTGAVGRMIIDDELIKIIQNIKGQILVEPFGNEIMQVVEQSYVKGRTIQDACFQLVNKLFEAYGLIVLLPDNAALKKEMLPIFLDDIFNNTASEIVNNTSQKLSENYKVQAHPREINLFYLKDNIRERIIKTDSGFSVHNSVINFTEDELRGELKNHPERFSPNVILRAMYQETILPNIAFVGGGGELAYWLELKDIFQHYKIPYPVLILRNSFLIAEQKIISLIKKLSLDVLDFFNNEEEIINSIVKKNSSHKLNLDTEKDELKSLYSNIKNVASEIDQTLSENTESLLAKGLKRIEILERKMLKAEKLKFDAEQRQIKKVKSNLFPNHGLQERVENFIPYYAKWGKGFIKLIYDNSLIFVQQFCIIKEEK